MKTQQIPTLSWSVSTKKRFETCKRRHFYHRYWGQAPSTRWKIYEMRCITNLAKLRGEAAHAALGGALRGVRLGHIIDINTAKQSITEMLRCKYQESYRKMWATLESRRGRKWSEICNLHEHYYNHEDTAQKTRDARQVAWKCVENAMGSDLWRQIVTSDPKQWMEIDEDNFPSFDLDGIKVYTKIDFAHQNGKPTIIDWKSGSKNEADRGQLMVYALYAQAKWGWDPTQMTLAAAYLYPDYEIQEFTPSHEEVESTRESIKHSFDEMLALESALGRADIDDFPVTDDKRACTWCRFRGLCE